MLTGFFSFFLSGAGITLIWQLSNTAFNLLIISITKKYHKINFYLDRLYTFRLHIIVFFAFLRCDNIILFIIQAENECDSQLECTCSMYIEV